MVASSRLHSCSKKRTSERHRRESRAAACLFDKEETMKISDRLAFVLAGAAIVAPPEAIAKPPTASTAWAGTWHLNTAKSKFSSPDGSEKSDTRIYSVTGNRISMRSTFTDHSGKIIKWSYSAITDGRWNAAVGNPSFNRIALTLTSDRELRVRTTNGKRIGNAILTISANGKQLTVIRMFAATKPGNDSDTLVFDRAK